MISTTDHHRRKCDAKHLAVFPVPSKHLIDIWGERPWISDILESLDYNFYTKLWIVPKTKCSLSQMKKFSVAACFDKTDIKFSFSFMKIPILHSRMSYLKQPILKVKMSQKNFTWFLFLKHGSFLVLSGGIGTTLLQPPPPPAAGGDLLIGVGSPPFLPPVQPLISQKMTKK